MPYAKMPSPKPGASYFSSAPLLFCSKPTSFSKAITTLKITTNVTSATILKEPIELFQKWESVELDR